jgi:hypothetical protein
MASDPKLGFLLEGRIQDHYQDGDDTVVFATLLPGRLRASWSRPLSLALGRGDAVS